MAPDERSIMSTASKSLEFRSYEEKDLWNKVYATALARWHLASRAALEADKAVREYRTRAGVGK